MIKMRFKKIEKKNGELEEKLRQRSRAFVSLRREKNASRVWPARSDENDDDNDIEEVEEETSRLAATNYTKRHTTDR